MSYVLILGANSDIARATAEVYASNGYSLYLVARQVARLEKFQQFIESTHDVAVKLIELDILETERHADVLAQLEPKPTGVISAVGYLGDQQIAEHDVTEQQRIIDINYTACAAFISLAANQLLEKKSGFIIGISSVAGDRGRKSNYFYGSAKAAFSAFLSGLRNRLSAQGVHVLTVKPGFVKTSMTQHLDLTTRLTAQPGEVAQAIFSAQQRNKNILYVKSIWRWIMFLIKLMPEMLFKKTSL